jgi:hypothetical protein
MWGTGLNLNVQSGFTGKSQAANASRHGKQRFLCPEALRKLRTLDSFIFASRSMYLDLFFPVFVPLRSIPFFPHRKHL